MGRILKLFSSIKASKRWRRNSDLYQDVVNTMQSYTKQMQEDVTEKNAQKLYDISKELKKKADLYLASRKNPRTSTGKARYSMIQEIANLNMLPDELRDPIKVNNLKQNGKKLSEIVDEIRNNNVVDITNQANKKVYGAGASKRIRFEYMGRNGFFTQKQKIEENTVVGSVELIIDGNVVDRAEILTAGAVQVQKIVPKEPQKEKSRIKKFIEKIKNILRNWM